jgi:hypothetical protein
MVYSPFQTGTQCYVNFKIITPRRIGNTTNYLGIVAEGFHAVSGACLFYHFPVCHRFRFLSSHKLHVFSKSITSGDANSSILSNSKFTVPDSLPISAVFPAFSPGNISRFSGAVIRNSSLIAYLFDGKCETLAVSNTRYSYPDQINIAINPNVLYIARSVIPFCPKRKTVLSPK